MLETMFSLKRFSKEEKSWIMYDWANSVFATIMVAAIFPVFFMVMAGGEGTQGSVWWAAGLMVSRLIVGICAPLVGAIIEYKGYKKKLFVIFLSIGLFATLITAFMNTWETLLIGYIIANMFWSFCNQIYDAFLPDVTTKDKMDDVSASGFGWGYIGGSTIPFLISVVLLIVSGMEPWAIRASVIMTAVWWGIFSIPIIRNVHHKHEESIPKGILKQSFKNVFYTAKKIAKNKAVLFFIVAYFFYIDGVGTVINMATAFGSELGLDATGMIAALFVTQIVAFPFSIFFGFLAKKYNPVNVIIGSIIMYCFICILGFIMAFGLEEYWFGYDIALIMFWTLAFLVGTVQGGIQAISRSIYGRLIPAEESGDYFGFFEIFGRFSAILGPGIYAAILASTGRASFAIVGIIVLFFVGLFILLLNKKKIVFE